MIEFCLSRLLLLLFSCIGWGAGWSDTGGGGGEGGGGGGGREGGGRDGGGGREGPSFGETSSIVRVKVGQTAKLPCVVFHLSDKEVTWLRRRDLHILTTGHHTYSADDRFQIAHSPGANEWTLVVRFAQVRDSGVYECQVNADPKVSKPVSLDVLDATPPMTVTKSKTFVANNTASTRDGHLRVKIEGPPELFIEEGSTLTLTCLVSSTYGPSTLVYWYHDTRMLDYNSHRGGIKLKIDHKRGETASRLLVSGVASQDSGMYSCVPAGSHPASVRVHVHQGKQEAAIQQSGLNMTSSSSSSLLLLPPASLPSYLAASCLVLSALTPIFSPSPSYYGLAGVVTAGVLLLPYSSLLLLLLSILYIVFKFINTFPLSSCSVTPLDLCLGKVRGPSSYYLCFLTPGRYSLIFLCSSVGLALSHCNYGRKPLCFASLRYSSTATTMYSFSLANLLPFLSYRFSSSSFLYKSLRLFLSRVFLSFTPPLLLPPPPPLLLFLLCSLVLSFYPLLSVAA